MDDNGDRNESTKGTEGHPAWKRWATRVGVVVVGSYLAIIGVGWYLQSDLIYEPAGTPPPVQNLLPRGEEVTINSDGLALSAWFSPAVGVNTQGPGILFLGGKGGNRSSAVVLADALNDQGFAVLLLDYRGFGGNPGQPSENGLVADASAAAEYLAARPEVDPDQIVFLGESLGAAVAIRLAQTAPPAVLILRSPFTSLHAVPAEKLPFLSYTWILRDEYPSIDRIGTVDAPVLVVAGTADELIPARQSERIYEAANEPKEYLLIEGALHVDRAFQDGEEFISAVTAFIGTHS